MMVLIIVMTVLSFSLLIISAIGVLRLPSALARQHAVTKAATLSLSLLIIGMMLYAVHMEWSAEWLIKLSLLLIFLLLTLPLASHALARSSLYETDSDNTH